MSSLYPPPFPPLPPPSSPSFSLHPPLSQSYRLGKESRALDSCQMAPQQEEHRAPPPPPVYHDQMGLIKVRGVALCVCVCVQSWVQNVTCTDKPHMHVVGPIVVGILIPPWAQSASHNTAMLHPQLLV